MNTLRRRPIRIAYFTALAAALTTAGLAAELKVLSAGALEPAMMAAADGFRRQTGNAVRLQFATSGEIRQLSSTPFAAELVAGPDTLVAELTQAARVVSRPVALGRIGLGVAIPASGPVPDISTPQALKTVLQSAKAVVYNRASSGVGIEGMIQKLGLTAELASRTLRFPDAESVMGHLMSAGAGEIGFGAPTAIRLYTGAHLRYVGPVPAELQSYTNYIAVPTPAATPLAQAFLNYLAGAEARGLMKNAGVE